MILLLLLENMGKCSSGGYLGIMPTETRLRRWHNATPLSEPRPSIENMSPEDLTRNVYEEGAQPDHMDMLLARSDYRQGAFERLHKAALSPSQDTASEREWGEIEFRFVWCDRAAWLLVWSAWEFKAEITEKARLGEEADEKVLDGLHTWGEPLRRCLFSFAVMDTLLTTFYLMQAHWDEPERTLSVLLADEPVE
jgi:hypothetical protein